MKEATTIADIGVGLFFCAGIAAIYIPQHVKCYQTKSSEGLSIALILITTISSVCLVLATILHDKETIQKASGIESINVALPSIQNTLNLLVGIPSYLFWYFYYYQPSANRITWHVTLSLTTWSILLLVAVYSFVSHHSERHVDLLGAMASLTNLIQWGPQIYTTAKLQKPGALSLTSMVLSVAGDMALLIYWYSLGESGWVYGVLVADAVSQGCLIALVLYFLWRDNRRRIVTDADLAHPLLNGDNEEIIIVSPEPDDERSKEEHTRGDDNDPTGQHTDHLDLEQDSVPDDNESQLV